MSLFFAELRKVWGNRVFPALLAILAAANLLLLWMGTRPTAKQPPASAYRAVGAELSGKTMEEKGAYLHDKYTEIESLVKIGQYYREQAYGGYGLTQYRQDNAAMFDAYEQAYTDKTYGEHEPYTRQGLLEFGGCFFVCGSGRQPIQRDKTVNDNYYLLTLAAIAKEIMIFPKARHRWRASMSKLPRISALR